jgi:hypothetical protein
MDLLTRADFESLVESREGVDHVSLFMPTQRGGREAEADRLRFKNLLAAVESALLEEGRPRAEVARILRPAWDLHGDARAWNAMADGLACWLRDGEMRSYRVPVELPEIAAVGESFIIGPALPMLTDQTFIVLALSQKKVRVLRGSRSRVGELDLPDVPRSFEEVFEPDGPRSDTVPRPTAGHGGGAGGTFPYGSGADDNVHKEEVTEFFRAVADGVHKHIAHRTLPMVLAGLPEWVAVYRDVNRYPHVLDQAIERNPDDLTDEQLQAAAWQLVEQRLRSEAMVLMDRLGEQRGRGGGAVGPEQVLAAAREGRVDTMLVTPDGCWRGGTGVVHLGGLAEDPCALIDAAAMATLRTGGAVRVVDELPEGQLAAAVLRY